MSPYLQSDGTTWKGSVSTGKHRNSVRMLQETKDTGNASGLLRECCLVKENEGRKQWNCDLCRYVNTSKGEETSKPEHNAGAGTIVLEKPRNKYGEIRRRWLSVRAPGSLPWLNPEGWSLTHLT